MKAAKFLYGILGICVAVLIYWYVGVALVRPRVEHFGAQEQLASRRTEVAPVSDTPKTKGQLQYLFKDDSLPPYTLDTSRIERPYLTNPINSLDDYEYNLVFQNEGSREMTQQMKNALTSAYPMDWAAMPPSAAVFQAGVSEMYSASPAGGTNKDLFPPTDTYKAIEDASLMPPDMDAIEAEEKKILATYQPKKAGDLTTYDVEDAKELINKIYDKRGEIPEIVEKPQNVFEVVGVQKKNPTIVYEDEPAEYPVGRGQMDVIATPQAAADTSAALDPFYEARNTMRPGRTDYTRWTPGLERMFAPTYEKTKWY